MQSADYSVVISHTANGYAALAFEVSNKGDPAGPLDRYIVAPKEIEEETGFDLFAGQAEKVRERNEGRRWERVWN